MNLMKARIVLPLLGLLCGAVSLPASTILLGDLSSYTSDALNASYQAGTSSVGKAVGFTMGTTDYNLDSVSMRLAVAAGSTPVVEIWSGTSTAITGTSALLTLTAPTLTTTYKVETFTAPTSFTLTAGSTYYLVLRETGGAASTSWSYATGVTPSGLPGVSAVNRLIGTSSAVLPSAWTATSGVNPWFDINVSAVPEPTAASALLFGSVVWLGSRLRRRAYAA